jgi:hypothetical protein
MVLIMLSRGCQAIRDLGTLDLVGEYASGTDVNAPGKDSINGAAP